MPCDDRDLRIIAPLLWADRRVNNNSNNYSLPLKQVENSSIGPDQMLLTICTGLPKLDIRLQEKLLPGLMSLSFCCNIQMVWSNMKTRIHPALSWWVHGLMWWYNGVCNILLLHLMSTKHHLNTTAYLSIEADHVMEWQICIMIM